MVILTHFSMKARLFLLYLMPVADCIDHSDQGVDSCCSVMCTTTLAFFITEHQPFTPHAVLLLINAEATRGIVMVARSLYRPPVV
jgi:hypothetical protein